jgi:plastocyanin
MLEAVAVALTAGVAGCGGTGGEGTDTQTPTEPATATGTPTQTTTATEEPTPTATETVTATGEPTPTATDTDPRTQVVAVGSDGLNFDPESFTIAVGDTVRWEWEGDNHNVTPEDVQQQSSWLGTTDEEGYTYDAGYTHSHTFEVPGEYTYYCDPHRGAGMTGSVTVTQ